MYFKEFLRVRNVLLWYVGVLVVLTALIEIVALASPESMRTNGVSPWVTLFGVSGFFAAIVATTLGSTLAQENNHLEVAWTRPRSRTNYATALMAVDTAGIFVAQLIAFAFIMAHYAIYHRNVHLIGGADDMLNSVRFALFPIALYALIVALSASLRGKAGLVQGLIWPIATTLAVLAAVPMPEVWHRILVGINLVNPMAYITYHDHGGSQIIGMLPNVALAVAALALIAVASWLVATYQWRRLQV